MVILMTHDEKKTLLRVSRAIAWIVLVLLTVVGAFVHSSGPRDLWDCIMLSWIVVIVIQIVLGSKIKKMR